VSRSMEQQVGSARRAYRKTRRADDERRTRARIVDAAETLHGSVGPAHASIAAVARTAGVTRATVYRHFPDDEALFQACSAQWLARQRRPDPDQWTVHQDAGDRLTAGLTDVYRYYREGASMLRLVIRDAEVVPEAVRAARLAAERAWVETMLEPFPGRSKVRRAAVTHAVSFATWRSLCVDGGLSDRSAVALMTATVRAAAVRP
jgi:AcrR family transcriptional regulator